MLLIIITLTLQNALEFAMYFHIIWIRETLIVFKMTNKDNSSDTNFVFDTSRSGHLHLEKAKWGGRQEGQRIRKRNK